jgi:phosphoribosylformylglycinamidine synthase
MPPTFLVCIDVMLKPLVNDPQGLAVRDGLRELGFGEVQGVRVGKHVEITVETADIPAAEAAARSMCEKLLANPVIESFTFEVAEAAETTANG